MGSDIINDDVKKNLTYFNFCLLLIKEIEVYFFSFFEKRIKQYYLSPVAYEARNIKYIELIERNENIHFDLYI